MQFVGTNVGIANKAGIDDAICQPYKVWQLQKGSKVKKEVFWFWL